MSKRIRSRRRWQALVAAPAVLIGSFVAMTATAGPSAADNCAKRYVAQGDGVVFGTDVENSLGGGSSAEDSYPAKLLNDHLATIPGGTGAGPWCVYNTATDPATTSTFVQGTNTQQSQAWNLKPALITLQLGRQNATIVDQIDKCFNLIKQWNLLPAAYLCAKNVLNDTAAWPKLQKDLSGILNTYKTQMSGNPSLVVAVLGYYNPYPAATAALKVPRLCLKLVDSAIPCMAYWLASFPLMLRTLDQVVRKLNDTISPVVRQFTIAAQGRFFFVNPYDQFKKHCTQMNVLLSTPLVYHPPAEVDSHFSRGLLGCKDNWVARDSSAGGSPVFYLIPVAPPGIPLAPPVHVTEGMGVNPNKQGHECLSDLIWETVKNKLGVPEPSDVAHACSAFDPPPADPPPADLPPPAPANPNPVPPAGALAQSHVAGGLLHTCAVLAGGGASGPVRCWGNNANGQLGNASTVASSEPVAVSGISDARAVAAAGNHTCALRTDGTVWCWGSGTSGELGNGTTIDRTTPVQASGVTGATAVAAGAAFTCAIVSGGTVKCWGDDTAGQLGDGAPGTTKAVPTAVSGITTADPAIAITAGDDHACAILADKTVTCWGDNEDGQLGDRTFTDRSAPVAVAGLPDPAANPPVSITAGTAHTCVLLQDNSARCWGDDESGQLGYPTPPDSDGVLTPSAVPDAVRYDSAPDPSTQNLQPLYGLTAISAGGQHTCGLMSDGSARCWGSNGAGQLGFPDPAGETPPIHPSAVAVTGLAGASAIAAGAFHSCAVVQGQLRCWGYDSDGQLGYNAPLSRVPVKVKTVGSVNAVSVGTGSVCALDDANKPECWGDNSSGQLGSNPPPAYSRSPLAVPGMSTATAIDAGNEHACAIASGGTNVQCWGRNGDGQLGSASNGSATAISAGGGLDAAGTERGHTCAVRPDTTVACWGRNADGQLGNGTAVDSSTPVTVQIDTDPDPAPDHVTLANLTGVTDVQTGGFHSCALVNDGTVWCWGRNDHGQLGDGTVVQRTIATQVQVPKPNSTDTQPLTGAVALAAGLRSTCAIVNAAGVRQVDCWGANDHGQLGDGTTIERHLPAATASLGTSPVSSITAGDVHACVRRDDDAVLCWGGNSAGQVGDGTTADAATPELILASPPAGSVPAEDLPVVKTISAGRANTCVVQGTDNKVFCWGDNAHGQLSDGVGMSSATPLQVDLVGGV